MPANGARSGAARSDDAPPDDARSGAAHTVEVTLPKLVALSSRTFAVGIELLPPQLREEVGLAYLLLRVSDYLEDATELADADKARLLLRWRAVLGGGEEREALCRRLGEAREDIPDALVARHAARLLEALDGMDPTGREIVVRRVRETTAGMARWAERGSAFDDESDLDDYMHEVAGRVGLLLAELFAARIPGIEHRRERMMRLGREFGLALQTVNVIRGLHEDRHRGWYYLPASFLPDGVSSARELFEPAREAEALAVLDRLARKADGHLRAAPLFIRQLPRRQHRARLFCMLPMFFAVRTLAVCRGNAATLRRETKMTRAEVVRITRLAWAGGFSNRWIASYCHRLARSGA